MSRLIDRMRRPRNMGLPETHRTDALQLMGSALRDDWSSPLQVIDAGDVLRGVVGTLEKPWHAPIDTEGERVISPPFRLCLIEARTEGLGLMDEIKGLVRAPHAAGLLMWSEDLWAWPNTVIAETNEGRREIDKGAVRWRVLGVSLLEAHKNELVLPLEVFDWYVAPDGTLTKSHSDRFVRATALTTGDDLGLPNDFVESLSSGWILRWGMHVTALLNCKNIARDEHDPPEKPSRKHERRFGVPLTKYYTLRVPGHSGRGGDRSEDFEKNALHMCRGHFKTYTDEKPLFGKRTGTYWWPQTVRGSKARGEVVKDYAVKPGGGS